MPKRKQSARSPATAALATLMVVGVAVVAPLAAMSAVAQPAAIGWEPLPEFYPENPNDRDDAGVVGFLSFEPGHFDVIASTGGDLLLWEGSGWTPLCARPACRADDIAVRDSVIMMGDAGGPGGGGALSLDGGQTWTPDIFRHGANTAINALFWSAHPDTDGALYLGGAYRLHRSDSLGRKGTYVALGQTLGLIEDLAEVPPSTALPTGRILAAVWNGLSYSDDGGETFQPSNVHRQGGLIGTSLSVHPDPTHPFGAVAYAAVTLAGEDPPVPALFRSDDGGAAWAEVARFDPGAFGVAEPLYGRVLATSDGALWFGVLDPVPGRPTDLGTMLRSEDGGKTLEEVDAGYGGYAPHMLAEAPDGRVYVASDSLVWRTVDPVVAVANAPEPPESARLGVRVEPNPSTGRAMVRWQQTGPGAARVSVFDARGREVLVLADSLHPSGEQSTEVDTSALAPGVYLVRVVTEAGGASARLVVAR